MQMSQNSGPAPGLATLLEPPCQLTPWQCIQVDELGTEYARSVTEFSLELILKLGERLRIPMDVFSGTWLDGDTVERILCERARGNSKACENREKA